MKMPAEPHRMEEARSAQARMQTVIAETRCLAREGKLDDMALRRLRQAMDAAGEHSIDETEAILGMRRPPAPPARRAGWPRRAGLFVVLGVGFGLLLDITLGQSFVFAFSQRYRAIGWWVFIALLPVMGWLFVVAEGPRAAVRERYRGGVARTLMTCGAIVVAAGTPVLAPLGWIAAYGRLAGTPVQVDSRLLVYAPSGGSRFCERRADIAFGGRQVGLCLSTHLVGPLPPPGAPLRLSGLQSPLGFYVQRIERHRESVTHDNPSKAP